MFGGEPLQPLLHVKHRSDVKKRSPRPAVAAARRRHALGLLGGLTALLAATAALLYLLYRRAPRQAGEAAAEEAQRDAEAERLLLASPPTPVFCALPPPRVCAHGGDVAAAPPNTAAAFAAALEGGARCVEVDVARTRDGQLVVLHARELAHLLRLAGLDGVARGGERARGWLARWRRRRRARAAPPPPQVGDFTWRQLAALRWEGGQRVELAEAVLRQVAPRCDQVTLDVKTHTQAGEDVEEDAMAQAVLDLVARTACDRCLVWAKSDAVVRTVKQLAPAQRVGYVVVNETAAARAAGMHRLLRYAPAEVVALHYAMASDAAVTAAARAARKQVHAWTANTAGMMRAVLDAGVDAVVTNHPRKLQAAVESRVEQCRRSAEVEQGGGTAQHEPRGTQRRPGDPG